MAQWLRVCDALHMTRVQFPALTPSDDSQPSETKVPGVFLTSLGSSTCVTHTHIKKKKKERKKRKELGFRLQNEFQDSPGQPELYREPK